MTSSILDGHDKNDINCRLCKIDHKDYPRKCDCDGLIHCENEESYGGPYCIEICDKCGKEHTV